jgi:hypothetical protein
MKTRTNLIAALAFAVVAGCAGEAPDGGGDDGGDGGGGGGGDGGGDPTQPLDAGGKYQLQSKFDLATNAPGTAGDVARAIIDMTDNSDDPANYILTQLINQTSGTFKSLLNSAKPFIAGYLNDRLLEIAPDFVPVMVQVGNDFGDVAKNFGLNSTLEVSGSGASYTATHTVLGAHFKVNGVETDYNFADFHITNTVVNGVGVTVDPTGKLSLADHKVPLSYGAVLRLALDAAIIPSLDPSASSLNQLLADTIDCNAVGFYVEEAIESVFGFGPGAGTLAAACNVGLNAGATFVYNKLAQIDGSALELGLAGTAKIIDKTGDRKLDTIQTGQWTGNATYGGSPAPLATATFFGARM